MKRRLLLCLFSVALVAGTLYAQEAAFRHPGLLHSEDDFEAVRARLASGDEHALEALEALRTAPPVNGDHGHNWGVNEYISRGISGQENYMNAYRNAARAYQCALLWKITGDEGYGDVAIDVLNAYRIYNKGLAGNTNVSLIPGFIGYQFINAAEIMRDYKKWPEEDFELFKQYMIDVWFTTAQDFLERRHDTVEREQNWYHYHSNWGLGNALFCVSLGVLCDLPDIYNYGMYWLKEGPGNESLCVTALHPDAFGQGLCGYGWGLIPWFHKDERAPLGYLNQMQESGRDQGHAMAALGLLSYAFESAYNQGDNAFCNLTNTLIPGQAGAAMVAGAAEYVAAYNSGTDDLPYKQNWWMGGLNATGRGQWRPIWQLFINHYENRMGIPMNFCRTMKGIIGMERGGGSYGNNSGGYDHTGFGDLMYSDRPVTAEQVPTILFPVIAGKTETRKYAEIRDVEPGAVLTLSATLPEGESNTGKWTWDDGAAGQQRQVTAEHSGIYRLTYTNTHGIKSTQMFSVSVRGEGIKGTLSSTAVYNGQVVEGSEVLMGKGRSLTVSTSYTNWNYIESEIWYDENGRQLATGGSYTYTLEDDQEHELIFRLTNQSGVVIEKSFHIIPNENELTHSLPDPDCEKPELWAVDVEGFQKGGASVSGLSQPYIERKRTASEDGRTCWGQERFNIFQTLEGLKPGKYELGASVIATQQGKSGEAARNYVKDVYLYADGVNTPVASLDGEAGRFTVEFYVGEEGKVTFGAKNMTDQNYAYSANGMNWFAMDNFSLLYLGETDLSVDLSAMRKEADAIREDEVTPALWQQLLGLKESASDGIETAVRYQRVLGEIHLLQVHYEDYKDAYERYKKFVETEGVDEASLKEALELFAAAGSADEVFRAYENLDKAWKVYLPHVGKAVDVSSVLPDGGCLLPSGNDVMFDNRTHWMTDAEGGNYRVFAIDGSDAQRGDATGENMIERYCTGNFLAGQRLIYASASGLPVGRYIFKAVAQKGADGGVIELFANDGRSPVTSVKVLRGTEVATDVLDQDLTVGVESGLNNACQWVSFADVALEYQSPYMLLEEAVAASDTLTYGEDKGGALKKAVDEARVLLVSGEARERMAAYHTLLDAMEQYRLDNASVAHPVDLTARIQNAGFDIGNTTGWTLTVSDANYPKFSQGVMEFWHTTFDCHQLLTGLPLGNYRVSMQARSDLGASNKHFRLYVKTTGGLPVSVYSVDKTRADGENTALHLGQNAEDLNADATVSRIYTDVFVGDGQLAVGAVCDNAGMWCVMNDFVLEYLGVGDDDLRQTWEAQVDVARSLDRELLPQAVETLLDEAVAVDVSSITVDSLGRALSGLMKEIENARSVMVDYEVYRNRKMVAEEIAGNSVPKLSSSLTIFKNNIASAATEAEKAVDVSAVQKACENLESARQRYVIDAEPLNGIAFDMTFKVNNAACDADGGWLNDGTVNFRSLVNTAQNGEYGGGVFYENWIGPGNELKDGKRLIYRTVGSLPNGNYELTAAAFRKVELSSADVAGMNVALYLNGQQTDVTSAVLDYFSVEGAVSSRTAEIGLVGGAGNTANWVGLADVKLMYYGSDVSELSEDDSRFDVRDGTYGTVTVRQNLLSGLWNMVCLPFDLSSAQVRKYFEEVKALESVELAGEDCNLNFGNVRDMVAGVPYLVKVAQTLSVQTYEKVTIDADAVSSGAAVVSDGAVTACLQGTFQKVASYGDNVYAYEPNVFSKAETGMEIKAFRGYLELEGVFPKRLNLYIDGEQTGVRLVKGADEDAKVNVYTTDGKLIRSAVKRNAALQGLPSGVYVVDGKKCVK